MTRCATCGYDDPRALEIRTAAGVTAYCSAFCADVVGASGERTASSQPPPPRLPDDESRDESRVEHALRETFPASDPSATWARSPSEPGR